MQLQKLLYYTQGFYLAIHNDKLFEEDIIKWTHGPLVREVYDEYKRYKEGAIPKPINTDLSDILFDQKEIIHEVYNVYGQFSSWKLSQITNNEPPWNETSNNNVIAIDSLKKYFKTRVNE